MNFYTNIFKSRKTETGENIVRRKRKVIWCTLRQLYINACLVMEESVNRERKTNIEIN